MCRAFFGRPALLPAKDDRFEQAEENDLGRGEDALPEWKRRASARSCNEKLLELGPVEPDHRLPVDQRHWRGREAQLYQFIQRLVIGADVLLDKRDVLLMKELLHLATEQSARLRIHGHRSWHTPFPPAASDLTWPNSMPPDRPDSNLQTAGLEANFVRPRQDRVRSAKA